jgi:hypothetical protein
VSRFASDNEWSIRRSQPLLQPLRSNNPGPKLGGYIKVRFAYSKDEDAAGPPNNQDESGLLDKVRTDQRRR